MKQLNSLSIKKAGLELPRIGLGTARLVTTPEATNESINVIHSALDAGVNFLDTADFYDGGSKEMLIGQALKTRKREDVFICSKFGALVGVGEQYYGLDVRPQAVKNYLHYTLKRLGVDYIDMYQPSRIDPNIPVEETVGAVADMVKAGYVRYIGMSEVDGETLRRANAVHPVSLVEVQYSLLNRGIEDDLLPVARELGIGVIGFGVLFSGLIGGDAQQQKLSNLSKRMSGSTAEHLSNTVSRTDALQAIANEKGISLSQLAVAWILAQGEDIMALVGSRTPNQFKDTVNAINVSLTADDLKRIEQIIPKSEASNSYMLKMNVDKNGLFIR